MKKVLRFIDGMASAVDLFAVRRDPDIEEILSKSDTEALIGDWRAIGHDFTQSVSIVQHDLESVAR